MNLAPKQMRACSRVEQNPTLQLPTSVQCKLQRHRQKGQWAAMDILRHCPEKLVSSKKCDANQRIPWAPGTFIDDSAVEQEQPPDNVLNLNDHDDTLKDCFLKMVAYLMLK